MIRLDQPSDFPPTLRRLRQHAGLSQRNLGIKAGVTVMTVSHIELGKTGTTLHTLLRLADVLGYDLALIEREDT